MTESDKLCNICFTKDKMKCYNCTTCNNIICDVCFSKILLKNKTFNDDYLNNQLMYNCPFCKGENKMSINVNHSISNNIIKGLINHIKKLPSTPAMMDSFVDHFLYNQNIQYINENRELKLKIKDLENNNRLSKIKILYLENNINELKLNLKQQHDINDKIKKEKDTLEHEIISLRDDIKYYQLQPKQPSVKNIYTSISYKKFEEKMNRIIDILNNSSDSSRKSKLHRDITAVFQIKIH